MWLYWTIAFRNLLQAKRRTALLGSAIVMVTVLQVVLQSLSNGYLEGLIDGATNIAAGHVNVTGLYKHRSASMTPLLTDSKKVKAIVEEALPDHDFILERNSVVGKLVGERRSIYLFGQGVDYEKERLLRDVLIPAKESSYVDGGRDDVVGAFKGITKENGIVLFASQAEKLNARVGDQLVLQVPTISGTNVVNLELVAVMEDVGMISQMFAFMSRGTVQNSLYLDDDVGARILIYFKDRNQAFTALPRLQTALMDAGYQLSEYQKSSLMRRWVGIERQDWVGQKLDLTTWEDNLSEAKIVVNSFKSISYALMTILSIVIAVGIMNTSWISVKERTNEIGCIRAIGMSSRGVLWLFLLEAFVLGVLAALTGVLLGGLLVWALDAAHITIANEALRLVLFSNELNLLLRWKDLIWAVVFFSCITSISALFPALRAAHIRPIQAINYVQ